MKLKNLLPVLAVALFPVMPASAGLLKQGFTAEFDVYFSGIYAGVNKRQVTNNNDILTIHSHARPKGLAKRFFPDVINETSSLTFKNGQLKPIRYQYQQSGGKDQVDTTVTFDWDKNEIHISKGDQYLPLTENSFDVASFQFALMQQLKQGNKTFHFDAVTHRRINSYTAKVKSMNEEVETAYGTFDTVLIESVDKTGERKFLFWCDPKLDYLPVRVEHIRKGKGSSLLELKSLTIS